MPEAASRNNGAPYASPLAAELADDVLERFLRYVVIDTQADVESTTYPSSAKQLDLSRLLVEELLSKIANGEIHWWPQVRCGHADNACPESFGNISGHAETGIVRPVQRQADHDSLVVHHLLHDFGRNAV